MTAGVEELVSGVVATPTHGRWWARPPAGAPRGILVGFHGYAESGAMHLAELRTLPGLDDWALVAVDALHAFYDRRGERVLRGWMTRELREEAIADNVAYADRVLDQVRGRFGRALPVALTGFSQGASMAWRAALLGAHEVAAVVALGGDVPPELAAPGAPRPAAPPRVLLARGDGDEWYTEAKLAEDLRRLAALGIAAETLTFPGGHAWADPFRAAAGALLASLG